MLNWLQRGLVFAARFTALWRIMGLAGAFRSFILSRRSDRLIHVPIRQLNRALYFRSGADFGMLTHFYDPNYRIADHAGSPVKTIIDAGANIGVESLRFRHNHPAAHIVAIEPDSGNFDVLSRNCEGDSDIEPLNVALWSGPATLALRDGPGNEAFQVTTETTSGPLVEAISMEDILARTGWPRISILKLDIEGAEHELFSTGADRWIGQVDCIIMEISDTDRAGTAQILFKALDSQDFNAEILGENIVLIRPETGWRLEPQIDYRRPS
jgi:FkbM family methyltransferase